MQKKILQISLFLVYAAVAYLSGAACGIDAKFPIRRRQGENTALRHNGKSEKFADKKSKKGMEKMRKMMLVAMVMAVTAALGGCNTVEGVGRDIEHAGESIQKL